MIYYRKESCAMLKFLKKFFKTALLFVSAYLMFSLSHFINLSDIPLINATGLPELYRIAENEATSLIPEEVKEFIAEVSEKLPSFKS